MAPWRRNLHTVIFEADTFAGKAFDIALIIAILLSIVAVCLESVSSIDAEYHQALMIAEWVFTILFTIEYILRILCVRKPLGYIFSFYGITDFLAVVPTWLTLVGLGTRYGVVIRSLRLLRIFRIFKLGRLVFEAGTLGKAVIASRGKIIVFLTTILTIVVIVGAAMHLIEGPENGFTSIPQGMYWGIVTMTTVGYGDIAPCTILGKTLAAIIMILGYSLIIVPTGIISAELARSKPITTQVCPDCSREGHDTDATHCKFCGGKL
jgi:voltage-gated potassium channel